MSDAEQFEPGDEIVYLARPVFDLMVITGEVGVVVRSAGDWVWARWPQSGVHSVPIVNAASCARTGITPRLARRVCAECGSDTGAIERVLRRLASLRMPLAEKQDPERLAAAVVLAAGGSTQGVDGAAAQAEVDWRDVVMAAGLGQDDWRERLAERL